MKKHLFQKVILYVVLSLHGILNAQIGVNTSDPEAALDITATDKGLLIPRVALTSISTSAPVVNPNGSALKDGTMVWNTSNNSAVTPGFYYWSSSRWVRIADAVKSGQSAATASSVVPQVDFTSSGTLSTVGTNTTTASIDSQTITRTIAVSGFSSTLTQVTCQIQLTHSFAADIDLYLQSPNGQIIELTTDNGGFGSTTFNVTFSDSGASSITTWTTGNVSGTYKPEGTLTADVITPNITSMAGFNGYSPNGTWTLHIRDDSSLDYLNFTSWSLQLATSSISTSAFRLIAETSMAFKSGSQILTQAHYSANTDSSGYLLALTRSTSSAGSTGTTTNTLPGTVLAYAADSPNQGSGNYWASSFVQGLSSGLTDNQTYYFQIWAKGNVDSPTSSNEVYSLIPFMIPQ